MAMLSSTACGVIWKISLTFFNSLDSVRLASAVTASMETLSAPCS